MSKPRIAVLIDWYLPGTKAGGPVRSVYSLVSMLKDDFDFYIITTNTDLGSQAPYEDVVANKLSQSGGVHYYYFDHATLNPGSLATVLDEIGPNLVYLNSFWSYQFSIAVVRLKNAGRIAAPLLLAPRGMLGRGAMHIKPLKKQLYLLAARCLNYYRAVHFHATQQQELHDIRARFSHAAVSVAPNVNSSLPIENVSKKTTGALRLFFLSRISRVKNLHFALQLLANVPPAYDVQYDIYGNIEEADYWNSCLAIIKALPSHIQVNYRGELQFHRVQATISNYHALLMPTLNENFGHSIVESLLCGCLVIISDQTPWNDVQQYNAGYALDLGHERPFVAAISEMAALDQAAFSARSLEATAYIARKTNPRTVLNQYKTLLNERIEDRPLDV